MDVIPIINEHLINLGDFEKLDLFLYSPGGITMAGFSLVNLIREYCTEFNVIVPFKAYSCATLICLGANEIIMTKLGQLSPVDPSLPHPLAPQTPSGIIPISIEDVSAYINLANESGLKSEEAIQVAFNKLSETVHPLALGAVQRTKKQNEFLAQYLLSFHLDDEMKIDHIIKVLTKERFSHGYLIGRTEAKNLLRLNIIEPDIQFEELIMQLFKEYSDYLLLDDVFSEEMFLEQENSKEGIFYRAIIQTENLTHVFQTKTIYNRQVIHHPQLNIPKTIYPSTHIKQGWKKL